MKSVQRDRRTQVEAITDFFFGLYLFTEFLFKHTIIGQIGIVLFICSVFLLVFEKRRLHFSYYFIFSAIFILYNYINIKQGISIDYVTSLDMITTLITNFTILLFIFNYLVLRHNMQNAVKIFVRVCLLFTFLLILVSIPNLFEYRLGKTFTILGIGINVNSNSVSMVSALAFLMCYYNYLSKRRKSDLYKILWFIFIIFLTGSRKGFLIVSLGSAVLLHLMFPQKRTKNILIITALLSTFYVLIMYVPALYNIIGIRVEALINYVLGRTVEEASLRSRASYINLGWNYFIQKPWTGYGSDCFRHLPGAYSTYSHNNFIEILVSGGIPAFIIYYMPYLIILGTSFTGGKNNQTIIKLFFTLIFILLIMDYGVVSYYDRSLLTMATYALAVLHLNKRFRLTAKLVSESVGK